MSVWWWGSATIKLKARKMQGRETNKNKKGWDWGGRGEGM